MNAIEARNKSEKINTDTSNISYQKVMEAIDNAVNHGEYKCNIYNVSINNDLTKKLKGMGYTLNFNSDYRDGSYISISW